MRGITLIGMPGAGKSTIGKMLARKLKFRFVDLDILIKEKEGRSHAKILEEDGAKELLRLENLHTLDSDLSKTVFSPGGSIIYSKPAMEKLEKETSVFYLDMPLGKIRRRLGKNLNTRGIVGLKEKGLEGLFNERAPLYKKYAHYIINCSVIGDKTIANEILQHQEQI